LPEHRLITKSDGSIPVTDSLKTTNIVVKFETTEPGAGITLTIYGGVLSITVYDHIYQVEID
jgi:hypothetical protein